MLTVDEAGPTTTVFSKRKHQRAHLPALPRAAYIARTILQFLRYTKDTRLRIPDVVSAECRQKATHSWQVPWSNSTQTPARIRQSSKGVAAALTVVGENIQLNKTAAHVRVARR